jgi:hypothetical protein
MNKHQCFRQLIVGVLWLGMGAGCQRDDPTTRSCNDGTCCGQRSDAYEYTEYVQGVQADLLFDGSTQSPAYNGYVLVLKNRLPIASQFGAQSTRVCDLSLSKVKAVKPSLTSISDSTTFKYRVWGKLFYLKDVQTITATPVLYIYVDRIVPAK